MPKPKMNQTISWQEVLTFLSPSGQQQLIDFVREAQQKRGANWLPEIKAEFPLFSWIVDLVANKKDEAFEAVQGEFPNYPLFIFKGQIQTLHAALKAEIERKR